MLLVVDCRRGVGELDLALLEWAARPPERTHVLLSKADKLPRGQATAALREAAAALRRAGQLPAVLGAQGHGTG